MSDVRNVYLEPEDRSLIRTEDVYQTELENGTVGYSDTLLSVIANYTNSGAPEGFNAQSMVGKSKRGEVALRLFAVVEKPALVEGRDFSQARFVSAGFKTRGCLAMTACASVICQMIEGKTFEEALHITPQDVKEALDGVPWDKIHTTYFAVEGVHALIGDYLLGQGASLAQLDKLAPCDQDSVDCIMCEHCSLRDARINALVDAMVSEGSLEADEHGAAAACGIGVSAAATAEAAGNGAANADESTTDNNAASGSASAEDIANVSEGTTEGDSAPADEDDELPLELNNALADVFADVSKQSSEGELVTPARWAERGLVPEDMTAEDFEMFVYDYLEEQKSNAAAQEAEYAAEEKSGETAPLAAESQAAAAEAAASDEAEPTASNTTDTTTEAQETSDPADPLQDALPDGYELHEIDGELTLVPIDPDAQPIRKTIKCASIAALTGEYTYYLYDQSVMTDAYANWSFLAAEDNKIVTFTNIVREESRIYPRPMPATSLQNPPFNMTAEEVVQTFNQIVETGIAPDIQQTEASNGDIYYFSTDYLTRGYAKSLAEWASVERWMNI